MKYNAQIIKHMGESVLESIKNDDSLSHSGVLKMVLWSEGIIDRVGFTFILDKSYDLKITPIVDMNIISTGINRGDFVKYSMNGKNVYCLVTEICSNGMVKGYWYGPKGVL